MAQTDRNGATTDPAAPPTSLVWRGAWVASVTTYETYDLAYVSGSTYICLTPHTASAAFATDLGLMRWAIFAQQGLSGSSADEWLQFSGAPTYVSATSFTLAGDQTSRFLIGLSLKNTVTAGIVYNIITNSVFTTLTNVTVAGGALDAGLSSVQYGLIAPVNPSFPIIPTNTTIASAATLDLRTIKSEFLHVSGTNATSAILLLNGQKITIIADAAWPLTYHATTNNITTSASYTMAAGDMVEYSYDGTTVRGVITKLDGTAVVTFTPSIASVPVRQTVLSGAVDSNGLPNFGGSTGTTTVTASTTLLMTAANGFNLTSGEINRIGVVTNPQWTGLSTNGIMYLYADINSDNSCTPGSGVLAPSYRNGGADVVTNGQFTFNRQEMIGKFGNGTVASQVYRVYVGEVLVAGGFVSTITWYALLGRYESTFTNTLPAAGVSTSFNHNLGIYPRYYDYEFECITAEGGFAVGDRIKFISGNSSGTLIAMTPRVTTKTLAFTAASTASVYSVMNGTGGTLFGLTLANWKYRAVVERGWNPN